MSILTAIIFGVLLSKLTAVRGCSTASEKARGHCPPFGASFPSFPFSSSPGCGHPSFQVNCSEPFSTISINGNSFTVVRYDPNSTTLTLSPTLAPEKSGDCPHALRAINITGSPFRVADAFCSRLWSLRPCAGSLIPKCRLCPWECQLAKNPAKILGRGCAQVRHRGSFPPCRDDVLEYLEGLLMIGIEIEWDESGEEYFRECRECKAKSGVCGFNSSDPEKRFVCFKSKSRFAPPWIGIGDSKKFAVLITTFSLVCLLLASIIVIAICRWRMFGRSGKSSSEDPTMTFLRRHRLASRLPPEFSYEELEISTNGFDPKRKIGDGGFGSVYLGRLADGKFVAVKYLHRHSRRQGREFSSKSFCNEILILSSIHHQNLVRLHGFCSDSRGLVLVYDYVPNGTLADHLHARSSPPLTWRIRIEIAVQTAAALEYLHFSVAPPVVHRDITSANIFVEKDMRVKVGDFGLSRLLTPDPNLEPGSVWTGPQGTPGYLDPDYHRSFRLTEKSDVYSFGVVLMELISGMRAVDLSRGRTDISLADHVVSKIHAGMLCHVVDPTLMDGSVAADGVEAAAELAFRCVAADRDDRPDAKELVRELLNIRSRTRGKPGIAADVLV